MHLYIYSYHHTIITLIVFSCRNRRLTVWYSAFLTNTIDAILDTFYLVVILFVCYMFWLCLLHSSTLSVSISELVCSFHCSTFSLFDFACFTLWLCLSVSLSNFVCAFHSVTYSLSVIVFDFAGFILWICLFHSLTLLSV